jgi:rubrerythrin
MNHTQSPRAVQDSLKASQKEKSAPVRHYICDRCGTKMFENLCKVICPRCGNRFDCSDLNIYFD